MTNTKKIPQVDPTWSYGIYTGKTVITPEPYGYRNGECWECERTDGTHARNCAKVN